MKILITFCCWSISLLGLTQSQDLQQLILNIEKLAQLKATYQTMVKGYQTLANGYRQISELSRGNFQLHQDHLNGLLAVSPAVRQNGRIASIVQRQSLLLERYQNSFRQLQTSRMLHASELQQFKDAAFALVQRAHSSMDELIQVLTPGTMRMNDEERIGTIHRIDLELHDLLETLRSITDPYTRLAATRARQKRDWQVFKKLYGIQP